MCTSETGKQSHRPGSRGPSPGRGQRAPLPGRSAGHQHTRVVLALEILQLTTNTRWILPDGHGVKGPWRVFFGIFFCCCCCGFSGFFGRRFSFPKGKDHPHQDQEPSRSPNSQIPISPSPGILYPPSQTQQAAASPSSGGIFQLLPAALPALSPQEFGIFPCHCPQAPEHNAESSLPLGKHLPDKHIPLQGTLPSFLPPPTGWEMKFPFCGRAEL